MSKFIGYLNQVPAEKMNLLKNHMNLFEVSILNSGTSSLYEIYKLLIQFI